MFRIPIADVLVSAALAAALAVCFTLARPELSSDLFAFGIGEVDPATIDSIPHATFAASVSGYVKRDRFSHRVVVTSPSEGLFTVTGAAYYAMGAAQNMQLWLNGEPLTFSMLEGRATSPGARPILRPIVHNARLRAGANDLEIRARQTEAPIVLQFQRQVQARWWRSAGAGLACWTVLLLVSGLTARFLLGALRPLAVIAGAAAFSGAALAWLHAERGAEFQFTGETAPELEASVQKLDEELAKPVPSVHARPLKVFTFGDSTHQAPGGFEFSDALAKALASDRAGAFTVYGMANGGMTARDYYLLLNKVLDQHPDVLVLPINLATFEDRWYENPMWHFQGLERFLRFDEFPRAAGIRVGQRRFRWDHILLQKFDAACFDRSIGRFIVGLRLYVEQETQRLGLLVNSRLKGIPTAEFVSFRPKAEARIVRIDPDNDIISVFRTISQVAAEHGIRVVYYTTPLRDEGLTTKGIFFQPTDNFATIQRALSGPGHVTFLTLHQPFPDELFRDEFVHLKPAGIRYLAGEVAKTVESLAAGGPGAP